MSTTQNVGKKPLNEPVKVDSFWGDATVADQSISEENKWFKEAKFAMFIHWGLYSIPGGVWEGKHYYGISEWMMQQAKIPVQDYAKIAEAFDPSEFDAEALAQLAVDAGMKYLVITTKHHDGFAMFESKASAYNIVDGSPFGRDPMKELAEACKRHGLRLGFYYSQSQDWYEKDAIGNTWDFEEKAADFQKYLREKAIPQVRELLTNYGDISIIWFDTPLGISKEQVVELKAMVKEAQPNCLVNSRIGQGLGDFITLGDNEFPDEILGGLWESIDTHNNSWAFSQLDINWKSASEVIDRLVGVLCKGGNFMLNVGPMGNGAVPEASVSMLREVGTWVKTHSEAIYGTLPVNVGNQVWVEATRSEGKTYLFVRDWPVGGKIWLPGFEGEIDRVYLLGDSGEVALEQEGENFCLQGPAYAPDPFASVIVLEHSGPIAFDKRQWLVPGMKTRLLPLRAELKGVHFTRNLRWMEIFGDWHVVPVLQNWEKAGSRATWEVYSPEACRYFVDIEYSCNGEADLKEGVLEVDGERHPFVPVYTGDTWSSEEDGWGRSMPRFMTRRIGMISVEKGSHRFSIEAAAADCGDWIRLSKLELIPV